MKLGKCQVENFGSYDSLDFDFSNLGLSLIYGPTGAGKSTLMDAAYWCLFGTTVRGGGVEDVRSWNRPESPTRGCIDLISATGEQVTIVRVRGKSNQNDLYWIDDSSGKYHRGVDLKETQKFINIILGVDSDLYLNAVYYSEFSPSGSFFTANAKARRDLLEKIADLSFPLRLADKTIEAKKNFKDQLVAIEKELSSLTGHLERSKEHLKDLKIKAAQWDIAQKENIQKFQQLTENFDSAKIVKLSVLLTNSEEWEKTNKVAKQELKKTLQTLEKEIKKDEKLAKEYDKLNADPKEVCGECQQFKDIHSARKEEITNLLKDASMHKALYRSAKRDLDKVESNVNHHQIAYKELQASTNTYDLQLQAEKGKTNPFIDSAGHVNLTIDSLSSQIAAQYAKLKEVKDLHAATIQLYDLSIQMRGFLVNNSVKLVEEKANYYLSKYFDSEFKITLLGEDDNVNLVIYKNGYICNFKQLSKGQRGILRLCFAVSFMLIAANNSGIHFDNLFFDESLDGLDVDFKIKAYSLFSELAISHGSILVIDHATEFKSLFQNQFEVTLVGDSSRITSNESDH